MATHRGVLFLWTSRSHGAPLCSVFPGRLWILPHPRSFFFFSEMREGTLGFLCNKAGLRLVDLSQTRSGAPKWHIYIFRSGGHPGSEITVQIHQIAVLLSLPAPCTPGEMAKPRPGGGRRRSRGREAGRSGAAPPCGGADIRDQRNTQAQDRQHSPFNTYRHVSSGAQHYQ